MTKRTQIDLKTENKIKIVKLPQQVKQRSTRFCFCSNNKSNMTLKTV